MKFLVFGHKGWIGGQVIAHIQSLGHEAIGADSRAENEKDVEDNITRVNPDRVISLIGRTRGGEFLTIDYLEQKGKLVENMRDNLWGPMVLAALCKKHNVHFTYLGTGCVFHYDNDMFQLGNGNGFKESDIPNFFGSSYSTVKGYTDRMMHLLFNESALNCRIRMPITPDNSPYNFITKIAGYSKVINVPNSMTVLPELIPVFIDLSINKTTGTINLTNPGAISHNEVLALYQQYVDPSFKWENFTIEEQDKILLGARSNNLLDSQRLQELYPNVDDIHTAVAKVCQKMKEAHPDGIVKKK
ncbi:epimerase, putative [Bodo saltans]|uniref:Epimerase, putative n=1 Tax=Bodo saltans TaxID=75058 RepID=A0A0S4JKS1_BODSA|nr:epimerase, putative [Bodo saltans]|eukprot:CUG90835.1 epimerase, putative [Bodo saltans]